MVACVIQAAPEKTPLEIVEAVQKSADRYPQHDIQRGYGIPNFEKVLQILEVIPININNNTASHLLLYPNPVKEKLFLSNLSKVIRNVELYDVTGRLVKSVNADAHQTIVFVKEVSAGFLFVKVLYDNNESEITKCVILK
jgi:hypothetical protein